MIVDPDPKNLELLKQALLKKGSDARGSTSGIEAIDVLNEDEYHLIIAECDLQDLDGFTFFETVRFEPRTGRIPFIFLTANNAPEARERAFELGCDGYLVKPITSKELYRVTGDLLERSQAETEGVGIYDLAGRIGAFAVEEIVQILQAGGKTGHLMVSTSRATADIFFDAGSIFNANFAGIEGDEAIYLIFAVKEGRFSFRNGVRTQIRNVTTNVSSLLLEGMRRMDEAREAIMGRGSEAAPSESGLIMVGEATEEFSAKPMEKFLGEGEHPSPEQLPDAAALEPAEDFVLSFDEEEHLEEISPEKLPEPEPLPGHGKRLAGAPPPPPPPGGAPRRAKKPLPKGREGKGRR